MKKVIVYSMAGVMLLCSCSSAESGAYSGAMFGSILGSAIGGITGGYRGSDIGTVIGMAGGAAVGAAIGDAKEKEEQRKYEEYKRQRRQQVRQQTYDDYSTGQSGFDPNNGGDDRIEMEMESPGTASIMNSTEAYSTVPANTVSLDQLKRMGGYNIKTNDAIMLRNVSFVDDDGNGVIHPGEESKVSFEIMNNSDVEIFNIVPTVVETTGNKHIHISPGIRIESIKPHQGVRFTATVLADKRLKDGNANIRIAVRQGNNDITSQVKEFNIKTMRLR